MHPSAAGPFDSALVVETATASTRRPPWLISTRREKSRSSEELRE
jgi:hypothetical protein